jgi:hypothetical protein
MHHVCFPLRLHPDPELSQFGGIVLGIPLLRAELHPTLPIPDLNLIEDPHDHDISAKLSRVSKLRRNQDSPLTVYGRLDSVSGDEAGVFSKPPIGVALAQEIVLDLLPGFDRVGCDAGVKKEINQNQLALSAPLEDLTVPGRDAEPPLVIDGVFKASAEHGNASPIYGKPYQFIPLYPTVAQPYITAFSLSR